MLFQRSDSELKSIFYLLNTREDVANILEISDKDLIYYLYRLNREYFYKEFYIPKRSGSRRLISAPSDQLKYLQKKIAYILDLVYKVKPSVYGFTKQRSILQNAKKHVKKRYVGNIDIKDFFPSINFGRILGLLVKKPYCIGKKAAVVIAQIATYKGHLPQGSPCSPILSNMICSSLDTQLIRLAKKYKMTYTRYADDITFSCTSKQFPNTIIAQNENGSYIPGCELEHIIHDQGFCINTGKVFLNNRRTRQEVTGLTVNDYPNVRKRYIRLTRSMLDKCKKIGIYEAGLFYIKKADIMNPRILSLFSDPEKKDLACSWFERVLVGRINFIGSIKGKMNFTYLKYAAIFNEIFNKEFFDVSELLRQKNRISNSIVVIENDKVQGTGFYLKDYGLVTAYHVTMCNEGISSRVYNYNLYDKEDIRPEISLLNVKKSSKEKDYAIYNHSNGFSDVFDLGDSTKLDIGEFIYVIGFPEFQKGDSPHIYEAKITGYKSNFFKKGIYTTDARIVHGMSGGPVLDKNKKVIGIIIAGVESDSKDERTHAHGFIPISVISED